MISLFCANRQVKSGSIFDNILVADSLDDAIAFGKETYSKSKATESTHISHFIIDFSLFLF